MKQLPIGTMTTLARAAIFAFIAVCEGVSQTCIVASNTAQSIPANLATNLVFSTVVSGTPSMLDSSGSKITIASPGTYVVSGTMLTPSEYRALSLNIVVNDSYSAAINQVGGSSKASHLSVTSVVNLSAGDFVRLRTYSYDGFTTYTEGSGGSTSRFSVVKLTSGMPQCIATAAFSQSIPGNSATPLKLQNLLIDTDSIHELDGESFKIKTGGLYMITGQLLTSGESPALSLNIVINGTYSAAVNQVGGTSKGSHANVAALVRLSVNDVVKLTTYSYSAFSTYFSSNGDLCRISLVKISD